MYLIKITDPVDLDIFSDMVMDLRLKVVDPVLELEDNTAGSLEFTVYQQNQGYGSTPETASSDDPFEYLTSMATTIRVYKETRDASGEWVPKEIWEGRPLSEDKDFYNGRKIYCEGAYAYFNDVDQPYKEYVERDNNGNPSGALLEIETFIKGILTEYNNKASTKPNRKFNVDRTYINPLNILPIYNYKGEIASKDDLPAPEASELYDLYKIQGSNVYWIYNYTGWTDATKSVYKTLGMSRRTGGETTKAALDSVIEAVGGHMKVVTIGDDRCLFYTAMTVPEPAFVTGDQSATELTTQRITFGENMLDLTRKKDFSDFFTVLLPVGAQIDPAVPETVESMCTDILNDQSAFAANPLVIYDYGTDVYLDPIVPPYDATHVNGVYFSNGPRRVFSLDLDDGNGYDFFLYTSAYYRVDNENGSPYTTLQMMTLSDKSAQHARIENNYEAGYDPGYGGSGQTTEFMNGRTSQAQALSKTEYSRITLDGTRISVPVTGRSLLAFAVATDYAFYQSKQNPTSSYGVIWDHINVSDLRSHSNIKYPKLYRMPYKRQEYLLSGVRKVPDSLIKWVGSPADRHWETDISVEPYASYGRDDCDIIKEGNDGTVRITIGNDKSAHYINRYPPFGLKQYPWPNDAHALPYNWRDAYYYDYAGGVKRENPLWLFLTGYFGHHVCRVLVKPGKTYYLNTRVTNPGFPDTSIYTMGDDPSIQTIQQLYEASGNSDKEYVFYDDGNPRKRIYNDIFAYAVVARRLIRVNNSGQPDTGQVWRDEVVSYKLANKSQVTTELNMEKIEIPQAMFPEKEVASFDGIDTVEHMEIWFTCDSCYINGTGNVTDSSDGRISGDLNPLNGYKPSIYIEDEDLTSADTSSGTDWHECVTIAPLNDNSTVEGYTSFPNEYYVNKKLADKYGVIVKRIDYQSATTPEKLMDYVTTQIATMEEVPAFEISAIDLRDCGLKDCESLALHQTIFIDSAPHGLDPEKETGAVLSQMSINLSDMASNTYTLGYQPYRGISQQNGG